MCLSIWSTYQNWICHCIIMLNFQLLCIFMPKGEEGTEKPSSSHCHLHPFKCPVLCILPCLTPVSQGSSLGAPKQSSREKQQLCLLPMDHVESSLVPSHHSCRQLVIQQARHSPPRSCRNACGVWLGRRHRKRWKTSLRSHLGLPWSTVLIKAYFILHIVDMVFQRKALSRPHSSANSSFFSSEGF